MQAAIKSGAMNTVHTGLNEGREIFVYDQVESDIRFSEIKI